MNRKLYNALLRLDNEDMLTTINTIATIVVSIMLFVILFGFTDIIWTLCLLIASGVNIVLYLFLDYLIELFRKLTP